MTEKSPQKMEVLAPAGGRPQLFAALEAGADAVYFGLKNLNARRGASNFSLDQMEELLQTVHNFGAKAYLTLNIALTDRELGEAFRIVQAAAEYGVDGVLIADASLLSLIPCFPNLEFHFSTQAGASNRLDVEAAKALGVKRVVLARENNLEEIRAAKVDGVELEIFVQGAMCFCVSGRCLMSSWGGGRSGNRGACTSPCRVPWGRKGASAKEDTPMSMYDLGAVELLPQLKKAGVNSLKIEGRLKNAAWVEKAVGVYKAARDGGDLQQLAKEARELGAYSGRKLTHNFLDGKVDEMCGPNGRVAKATVDREAHVEVPDKLPPYDFLVEVTEHAIECKAVWQNQEACFSLKKSKPGKKSYTLGEVVELAVESEVQGLKVNHCEVNEPELAVPPRMLKHLEVELSRHLRSWSKSTVKKVREVVLSDEVQHLLSKPKHHRKNKLALGSAPTTVRIEAAQVSSVLAQLSLMKGVIIEGLTAEQLQELPADTRPAHLTIALPPVFYEKDIAGLTQLVALCEKEQLTVEANSWGGWALAKQFKVAMAAGPGLGVTNCQAARSLAELGFRSIYLSVEADREIMETVTTNCPVPVSIMVYGRPPLMISRVKFEDNKVGEVWRDRRQIVVQHRRENDLTVFRPLQPFSLTKSNNPNIRAAALVVDLIGAKNPLDEWFEVRKQKDDPRGFVFNYERGLF